MSDIEPTCRELRPHLSAFIDGELDAAVVRRVVAHIAGCPECAEDVAALRDPGDRISAAFAPVAAPAGSALRALRRIESSDVPTPASRVATFVLEVACAAAAVLLAALVLALTRTERPASATAPDLQRILGQPAEVSAETGPEAPRTDSDLLATLLADPGEVVYLDERGRSR
jgi:anti-sigma factor RsiW